LPSTAQKTPASTRNNYKRNHIKTYQILYTGITPATVKKSIGLPASLPAAGIPAAVSVFALPLNNYTIMSNISSIYRDYAILKIIPWWETFYPSTVIWQKPSQRLTDGNLLYRRAVSGKPWFSACSLTVKSSQPLT